MKNEKWKRNRDPKTRVKLSDLNKNDQRVYQEIVEDILKSRNIPVEEVFKRMKKKKEELKNKK